MANSLTINNSDSYNNTQFVIVHRFRFLYITSVLGLYSISVGVLGLVQKLYIYIKITFNFGESLR